MRPATLDTILSFLTTSLASTTDIAQACGLPVDTVRSSLTWARVRGLVSFDHWHGAPDFYYATGSKRS